MIVNKKVDVLVVGAGAGGSAVVRQLAGKGLKVVCLEQGEYIDYSRFPSNFSNWFSKGIAEFNPIPSRRSSPSNLIVDDTNSPIKVSYFEGVGGSTILYSGHYPRFHPSDFAPSELQEKSDGWPVNYEDLKVYYDQNMKFTPVAGLEGDPAYPKISNLLPPIPLGKMAEKLATGFNNLGWHWWPAYSAIATRKFSHHDPCINLGSCNLGCPQRAKGSSDISYWIDSKSLGVELRTKSRAIQVVSDNQDQVSGVTYRDENQDLNFQPAHIVVLSCGGLGTPYLLLNSKSKRMPNGLANGNGLVGKNLMLHPLGYIEGIFEDDLKSDLGPQGCSIASHEFVQHPSMNPAAGGFTMQVLRGPGAAESALSWFKRGRLRWGSSHLEDFSKYYNRTAHISIIVEDPPEPENCVELLSESRNNSAKINYRLNEVVKARLKFGIEMGVEVMKSAGATEVLKFAPVPDTGWHLMGTCKMGSNHDTSVVSGTGESHEVQNLYIADASVFSSSGTVNPTATIHALALMIGEHILQKFMLSTNV